MKRRYSIVLALLAVLAFDAAAERVIGTVERADDYEIRVVEVVQGLENPWSLAFLPDGDFLVTERSGTLNLVSDGKVREVSGLPDIAATGQGGLLDIILHPDYRSNGLIYLSYAKRIGRGYGTAVARGELKGSRLVDVQEIFAMKSGGRTGRHFGSRLAFAQDGTLLFTIGERGEMERSQDLGDHAGKTIRINDDGSIPEDNPFLGQRGALPEIYSYGHRNAQGMVVDPETGTVWQHEHGPRGGDEVNIVLAGANYGWPKVTYGINYSGTTISKFSEMDGINGPEIYWVPSIAPSGMALYQGSEFPQWNGDLFVGALVGQHLRRLDVEGGEIVAQEVLFDGVLGRIRDVRNGPDGALWILTDDKQGGVYRLERAD